MSELDYYEKGETTYFALQQDPRFGYCLYVPAGFSWDRAPEFSLAVIVHGTGRTPQQYRSLFKGFAEARDCIILAPLFPARIYQEGRESNYKFMKCGDLRFDLLLLEMVREVRSRYRLSNAPFLLHGFSGGGHFAHRFFYLHPRQLLGVSIGAPGMVTLLDPDQDWHCGIRGMEAEFGIAPDFSDLRDVAVQMVIGGADTATWEITIAENDPLWMPGVNDAGVTRLDRLESLRRSFERHGIAVRHDIVSGVGHEGFKILEPVKAFFTETLHHYRKKYSYGKS